MEAYETVMADMGGSDTQKAIDDLAKHKLPTLFSHRQAYFVGAKAQAEITWDKMVEFLKAQKVEAQNMQTTTNLYDAFGLENKLKEWQG